jgi:hypothetical protein
MDGIAESMLGLRMGLGHGFFFSHLVNVKGWQCMA